MQPISSGIVMQVNWFSYPLVHPIHSRSDSLLIKDICRNLPLHLIVSKNYSAPVTLIIKLSPSRSSTIYDKYKIVLIHF